MPRDNRRHNEDESPRSPSGLSLSTGRFAGRPGGSGRTRHNPLRDEESASRSSRERTRVSLDDKHDNERDNRRDDRRRSNSPRENRANSNKSGGGRRFTAPEPEGPITVQDMLANVLSTLPSHVKHAGHGQSFRRGMDWQTLTLVGVIVALVIVIIMAIAHVGPFAPAGPGFDAERHTGVQSLIAVRDNGVAAAQDTASQVSIARPVEPALAQMAQHEATRQDLLSLSGQEAPFAFALNTDEDDGQTAPVLSDQSLVSLNNALSFYTTHDYDVSFLIMDLGTGRGIAGNLDTAVYGASSFKGPFCAYLAEDELNSNIDKVKSTRRAQIENTITWSDNESYSKLRNAFGTDGMENWLADAGVNTALVNDTFYPHYTGRQSALMWLKIYRYLNDNDSSTAEWFSDMLSRTSVSFLRNGALGTTSAGNTDYLPPEGSGELEADEEAAMKNGDAAADDEGDEANNADNELVIISNEVKGNVAVCVEEGSLSAALAEGLKAIEMVESNESASSSADGGASDGSANGGDGADDSGADDSGAGDSSNAANDDDAADADDEKTIASIGKNITVRNKAGWINGQEDDAICDSGIVTINGRDYLMVIMTSAPDSAEGEQAFAHLARTLFEIRSDLV